MVLEANSETRDTLISKMAAHESGLLLIVSGLIGAGSLALGLILGARVILLSGRFKRRLWSAIVTAAGVLTSSSFDGLVGREGPC